MNRITSLVYLVIFGVFASASIAVETQVPSQIKDGNWVCNARSLTGKFYTATGTDKATTQSQAVALCQAQSFRCYPTGCKQ